MDNRKKEINSIINKYINYSDFTSKRIKLIDKFKQNYEKELEEYTYIDYDDFLLKARKGGYIRYFDLNFNLKWGGILIKIENIETREPILYLMNSTKKIWKINFAKKYVFYKKHKTYNDKLRNLFLSYIND